MKYKTTQKDGYGNMRSLELDTGENNLEVPPMNFSIPQYEAVGGLAENHPGEPKGSDTVPAWLTPGEFVVNKEAVDMYGPQIKKMNDAGRAVQDGNMNPNQAPPMYASTGKAAKEYPAEKKLANQIAIYEHLKSRGLSDKAAAGLMAQIQHESAGTFDHQWQEHGGGGGHGLFQMDPNIGGWLGPYKGWLAKKYINEIELDSPVTPGGPVPSPVHKAMQFDSLQNQLDFAIDLYTNPNAVTHPTDPGHYYIGDQNAASVRTVLENPDINLTEMSNTLVDTWINPQEKKANPGNRDDRQKDTKDMWELIQKGAFVPPQDPSKIATWIKRIVKSFTPRDYNNPTQKELYYTGGQVHHLVPGGAIPEEDNELMKLIFDSQQLMKRVDSNPEMQALLNSNTDDSSTISNINNSGAFKIPPLTDYNFGTHDTSTLPIPEYSSNLNIPDIDTFNDIQPGPFTGGLGADEEGSTPLTYTMPEEALLNSNANDSSTISNINNSGAFEIPQVTVGDGREHYRPSGFVPTMAEASADMIGDSLELGNIAELEAAYQDALQLAYLSNRDDPDFEAKQAYVKIAKEKLDAAKFGNNMLNTYRDVAPQFEGDPQWIKDVAARKALADEQATIDELKSRLNDPNITEEYKKLLEEKIKEKQAALDAETTEETTSDDVQSRLSEAAKKISEEAAAAQQDALDSNKGKKALTDNTNTKDPKFKQVKGMLNFLFGDLIDGKELGRGVAIYLASRALGYDHNSTIGFVAKKYLTRVDAKNLAMDKFIKANAGKYEKGSLAEYKRTGDPNTLIPIGATARPTGEEKAYYNAAGQKRIAYKFKKKNAQGDDITYYSWDKAGGSLKARVDDNWTTDSSTVADTPEYNERMNKASTRIAKKIKELKESDQFDAYNRRKSGSGAMVNDYYTGILPENDSGAVARWAEANGFSAFQLDKGLQQAYTMAINEAKANPDANISSLVPYLEEATIKERLDSFKGVPRVSTAVVDGETLTMDPADLVILKDKISNVMGGDTNRFWNEAARVWKTKDPDSGKPWPEIFTPLGKQNNLPPFALFAQVMLDNKMEQMAGTQ